MLLPRRSTVLEVCLVLVVTQAVTSAEYEYPTEDDEYNGAEYSDDSRPDYTKYFGGEAAASGVVANKKNAENFDSGFIHPGEFASFFNAPINFGEPSTKESTAPQTFIPQPAQKPDPFEALRQSFGEKGTAPEANPLKKDYFEESHRKQQAEGTVVQPGPHYVSHKIPVPKLYGVDNDDDDDRAQSKDDVETIPPPLKGKHNKKKVKVNSPRPDFDGFKDSYDAFETLKKTEEQIEQTKIDPSTYYGGKNVDYNTGKSSSSVSQSQYPAADGYLASLKIPTTTFSPYQKYSFQPVTTNYEALQSKYLEAFASTASPLKNVERAALNGDDNDDGVVAPSENAPENLKKKDCRKIISPENAENMNCFVCEDALNKAKYTQCSYASSDEPVNQYAGSSLRYSLPVKAPAGFRYKRSPATGKYSDDPYFQVSQRNRKYFDDFEKEQEASESERQKDFHYKPYDEEEHASYSESQSSELLKEPGACQEVDREGMTCTVCKNSKTGGNFEQCSYTSAPKEQKYAYVAEKKYDSDKEPEESRVETKQSSEDPQKTSSAKAPKSDVAPANKFSTATKSKVIRDPIPELSAAGTTIDETSEESPETEESDDEEEESESDDEESDSSNEKKEESGPSDEPSYFNYGELKKDKKLVSDDPYDVPEHFAASVSEKKTAEDDEQENFDDYHYKLFPGLNKEAESKDEEQRPDASEQKPQDVEEVLAEFAKKDRSNCKKAVKNGMTCFLCVDQNKIQHEECMYVAESKPRPTHIAYHEVQRLKDPKNENQPLVTEEPEESKKVETITLKPLASETSKRKKFFKKVVTTPLPLSSLELSAAASDVYRTVLPFEKKRTGYLKKTIRDSKASGSAPDSERLEDAPKEKGSEEPEDPKEIDVGDEEGAYSHEQKPVYSKLFGTTLPQYMVEKTEFEKDFDAASGFD